VLIVSAEERKKGRPVFGSPCQNRRTKTMTKTEEFKCTQIKYIY
jgi:hypothetical protein